MGIKRSTLYYKPKDKKETDMKKKKGISPVNIPITVIEGWPLNFRLSASRGIWEAIGQEGISEIPGVLRLKVSSLRGSVHYKD